MQAVIRFIAKEYIENVRQKKDDGSARYSMPTFTADQARSFRSTLRFLNDKDRDILYLMFVSKKKQRDVLKILGRTQSSLVYDIKRNTRFRDFFTFHATSCTQPAHVNTQVFQVVRYGEARENMPPRSASHDQHWSSMRVHSSVLAAGFLVLK